MRIHREGIRILLATILALTLLNAVIYWTVPSIILAVVAVSVVLFLLMAQFFRNPERLIPEADDSFIYAPADGKIVVIEEAEEPEYFKDKRLQLSIFMSPTNVHVNRAPTGGKVQYSKYHSGKYWTAWHPKSSTENERTTIVIENVEHKILLRQIAGAMARRIVNYLEEGQEVEQGQELGFIKFGSRVDVFLPLDAKVEVEIGQKVFGNKTVLAKL